MDSRIVDYILKEVSNIAKSKYPNDASAQLHYTIGFITAELAECMHDDSRALTRFRSRIGPAAKTAKRG